MCGIVGYVGRRDACPILIKGLHRLEYRGYDSAGVALINPDGRLNVFKCKGKVSDLEHFLDGKDLGGNIGIAHTRWATHGVPNDANAHPHYSESENIALIHNGIIENYRVLKDALEQNGYTFRSSTDSEVLVNLIEYVRATSGCSLPEAVRQALRQVIGAYAIAVVEKGNHDRIVAARQSSPMVVGVGDGEFFLSSDAASIIEYTEDFVYVGDGEIAVIDRNAPLKSSRWTTTMRRSTSRNSSCRSRSWKRAAIPISCSRRFTSSPGPSSTASADASTPTPAR